MSQTEKNIETLADRVNAILDYLMAVFPEDLDELKTNKISITRKETDKQ